MEHTIIPLTLKSGAEIPAGCLVTWKDGRATLHAPDRDVRISARGAARALGIEEPELATLEFWSYDGIAESILGERIEADGIDDHGSPSWLLAFGVI